MYLPFLKMNYFFSLFFLFFYFQSIAQLVNIEKNRQRAIDTTVGSLSIAANFMKNTKSIAQINGSFGFELNKKSNTILLFSDISYTKIDSSNLINENFQHIRYNHFFYKSSFFVFEFFIQNQFNFIKLLKNRNILGSGFRLNIINKDKYFLSLAPLLMYEREHLSNGKSSIYNRLKGDLYLSTGFIIPPNIKIHHVTYYQPNVFHFSEYRLYSETIFRFLVWKNVYFDFNFNFSYDSNPPIDYNLEIPKAIPKLFYSFKNGLTYKF